jgi:hypothetical protein
MEVVEVVRATSRGEATTQGERTECKSENARESSSNLRIARSVRETPKTPKET